MDKIKFIGVIVAIVYILFTFFLIQGQTSIAFNISAVLCPLIAFMYFYTVKKKTITFSLFLIFFSIGELMAFSINYLPNKVIYILGNSIFILSYVFLTIEVCKTVCILKVLKNYLSHLFVLTALNVYIIYVLHVKVEPFQAFTQEFFIELTYNIVILLLLSVALLNYFYMDNKKSLYMFLGALCIVFAEVIEVTFLYITSRILFLHYISATLYLVSFILLYKQSTFRHKERSKRFIDERA